MKKIFLMLILITGIGIYKLVAQENDIQSIRVENANELFKAIGPNREILLKEGDYTLSEIEDTEGSDYVYINKNDEFNIYNVENMTIKGIGEKRSRIITTNTGSIVIKIDSSSNIKLENIEVGHKPLSEGDECWGAVIETKYCEGVKINNSILFGSGLIGLVATDCDGIEVSNCIIKQNSAYMLDIEASTNIKFQNTNFEKNHGNIEIFKCSNIRFNECNFINNWEAKYYDEPNFIETNNEVPVYLNKCRIENNYFKYFSKGEGGLIINDCKINNNEFDEDNED